MLSQWFTRRGSFQLLVCLQLVWVMLQLYPRVKSTWLWAQSWTPSQDEEWATSLFSPIWLLWGIVWSCFACWHLWRQHELAAQQIFSVQHQRHKVLHPEAQRRSGYHLQEQWIVPRTTHYQSSYVQTQTLHRYSRSCRQCWDLLILCWQEKVRLFLWFLPRECLDSLGEQNSSAVVVLMPQKWCAEGCAGWGCSNALLPAVGWQNAWAMSPWAHTSSRALSACRVEEGEVVFGFVFCRLLFLSPAIGSRKKNIPPNSLLTLRMDQDFGALTKKYSPLTCFDSASKNNTFPNGQDAFVFIDVLHLEKATFFWERENEFWKRTLRSNSQASFSNTLVYFWS